MTTQQQSDKWLARTDDAAMNDKIAHPLRTLQGALAHVDEQMAYTSKQQRRSKTVHEAQDFSVYVDAYAYAGNILHFLIRRLEDADSHDIFYR